MQAIDASRQGDGVVGMSRCLKTSNRHTVDGGCIFVLENLHPNEDTQDPRAAASAVPRQTFYPLKIGFAIMTPSADHLSSDGDGCDPDSCQNFGMCNDQETGVRIHV
eukprot:SAG31_NODE_526_length_14475_cov_5.135197_4_plen_107_part_00